MNPELKALIIDDEAMACDMLEWLIQKNVPAITQVKKATSATEGVTLIKSFQPHVLFLDIQMPFMTGFDVLAALPKHNFSVIFTTAYNKYAIKAIRFSALDYLLKPVDADELIAAMDRYREKHGEQLQWRELHKNFMENLQQKDAGNFRLALNTIQGIRLLQPDEIMYCKGENNYTHFYLADNKNIVVAKTIKEYESLLTVHSFIRIHKSWLVNRKYVRAITPLNTLLLQNGIELEISRRKRAGVVELIRKANEK